MSTFYIIRDEDDLTHHGIKGQKWGVRRFQNKDGSYTSAGKRRRQDQSDYKVAKALKKKGIKNLSNEELEILNNRLRLESEYKTYTGKGESYVKKFLADAGGKAVSTALTAGAVYIGIKYSSKYLSKKASDITQEVIKTVPNVAKDIVKSVPNAAKSVSSAAVKSAASSIEKAAKTNSKAKAVKKGLVAYGKAVDKLIGRR